MPDGVEAHVSLFDGTQTFRYLQQGHRNTMTAFISSVRVVAVPPPFPTPLPSLQKTNTKTSTRFLNAGWGFHRASTWMPTSQRELARDPATRDGGNHRRRFPMTGQKTDHQTTTWIHQPRRSTHWFAQIRRRTKLHQTRGRLDASFRQRRWTATRWPPSSTAPPSKDPGTEMRMLAPWFGICIAWPTSVRRRQLDDSPA